MHLCKATQALLTLIDDGPDDLLKYAKAHPLFHALERANRDDDGDVADGYIEEKLCSARGFFAILCGVGEDGAWTREQVRSIIYQDVMKLEAMVSDDGLSLRQRAAFSSLEIS
jgi:hypothetical protein